MNENHLKLFYITNKPEIALIAEKNGVDRIWVDLETRGKELRQKNLDTVKSKHSISDISIIKPLLTKSEMMVRINSWYEGSYKEIDDVINAGADIIMFPYWKTPDEVNRFVNAVNGRCKTTLLLETKEAVECINQVLDNGGFDEIHIGLNDLHLSYGMTFMFELLANGTVESLCKKFNACGLPYGFGGIAKLGEGLLPAENVIMEHFRLGSSRAILSRSFCDSEKVNKLEEIDRIFEVNMKAIRDFESSLNTVSVVDFNNNRIKVLNNVKRIVEQIKNRT